VIGIFLIYLILATQFNSYTQPLLILLTVPFAFVGVVLFLLISGTPLSTTVIYATVALAGIAVNDTIVLISFANQSRRDDGAPVGHAVTDAAVTRLRPILLTSLTTVAGLVPTAIGLGGTSVVWGPMASTIIFGLIFSTLTTLVIVPSFYGLLYDAERRTARRERRRERRSSRRGAKGIVERGDDEKDTKR
jgi:multidrug efflux pump subunit AcrB